MFVGHGSLKHYPLQLMLVDHRAYVLKNVCMWASADRSLLTAR